MAQTISRWSLLSRNANRSWVASPSTAVSLLRGALISGCTVAVGAATRLGDPVAYLHADPTVSRLLRGMALIKGVIAVAALAAVYCRLAWPVSRTRGAAYLICSWAIAASAMLIWQLTYIVPAALLFHGAALCLLLVGWRER